MSDFDAIIVGAGCAGSVAAYELAKAGKSVLVVERGNFAGAKNMTGGRIYAHSLRKVFPDSFDKIPFERKITHERISLMAEDANFTIDFTSDELDAEGRESYSVVRSTFDQWLADQAENAGAEFIYGIAVESLIKNENSKVIGVSAGDDEITAEVVILCDGVNSLLASEAVGAKPPPVKEMAVGIKQVFALPAATITDRVLTGSDDKGAAWLFAGDATKGVFGGGFMYTNKESISLGIVAGIEGVAEKASVPLYQMMEDIKKHPAVAPLIKGAKVVEHSGHMVPEGGITIMPDLIADGVMLAGESAMMCVNLGYMVRGMDYAIAAGQHAGIEAAKALEKADCSKQGLQGYVAALEESFVLKDLRQFKKAPEFLSGFDHMYKGFPEMVRDIMNAMFVVDGEPLKPIKKTVMPVMKKMGYRNLFKDVRGAMRSL